MKSSQFFCGIHNKLFIQHFLLKFFYLSNIFLYLERRIYQTQSTSFMTRLNIFNGNHQKLFYCLHFLKNLSDMCFYIQQGINHKNCVCAFVQINFSLL